MLDSLLADTAASVVTVTTLVTAIGSLTVAIRKWLGDRTVVWGSVLLAILSAVVAFQLGDWLLERADVRQVTEPLQGQDGQPFGYSQTVHKMSDYLDSYEAASLELQAIAAIQVGDRDPVATVRFSEEQQENGHWVVIDDTERDRVLGLVRAAQGSDGGAPDRPGQAVLIRSLADPRGSEYYNRKASLIRAQKIRRLLVDGLGLDERSVLLAPLGQSESPPGCKLEQCRVAEVFLIPQLADLPADATAEVERLRVIVQTAQDRWANTRADVFLGVNGYDYPLDGTFTRGAKEIFKIDLKKPKALEELRLADLELGHDNSGWSSDWKVETVRVEYTLDGSSYWLLRESPLLGWVGSDGGDGPARVAI